MLPYQHTTQQRVAVVNVTASDYMLVDGGKRTSVEGWHELEAMLRKHLSQFAHQHQISILDLEVTIDSLQAKRPSCQVLEEQPCSYGEPKALSGT